MDSTAPLATDQSFDETLPDWGAVRFADGRWRFSLWWPSAKEVAVVLPGRVQPLAATGDGFFQGVIAAEEGEAYRFSVDGDDIPDPAARAQAGGVTDASRLVDLSALTRDQGWRGRPWDEAVILEVHIGTFTESGTFAAAAGRLPGLAALGITAVELMPIGQFSGSRGWGYDVAKPFAPQPDYGSPQELRDFVDAAHAVGIMVMLDVVYNHFGPEGTFLPPEFFADNHTPWGAEIDYGRRAVRSFMIENALMWLTDYGMDGLRIDAAHAIRDDCTPHVLVEMAQRMRALDLGRPVHLITEDERNLTEWREAGHVDAEWNDDFHHAIHTLLTTEDHGFLATFAADPMADLMLCLTEGQARQGQDRPDEAPAGAPSGHLPHSAFVNCNQNHDQIGNRPGGERLIALADEGALKVAHALLLLCPFVPMMFMGEEEGDRTPFYFFSDYTGEMAEAIRTGREKEVAAWGLDPAPMPDPNLPSTFAASRPYLAGNDRAQVWRDLTARLLALRASAIVPLMKSGRAGAVDLHRTGTRSLRVTYPYRAGRLTIAVNLGSVPEDVVGMAEADFSLGDPARDPHAIAVRVDRMGEGPRQSALL